MSINKRLILIKGEPASGKTASLENIPNQDQWMYLNVDAGKDLPFRNNFYIQNITNPSQVIDIFHRIIEGKLTPKGVVVDTINFLMDLYESVNIYRSQDSRAAWGDMNQYFKYMMQQLVPKMNIPVIFIGHSRAEDVGLSTERHVVPVKGSLRDSVEAYFSIVVMARMMSVRDLEEYKDNGILTFNEDEIDTGLKYVFQTRMTEETQSFRIRGPKGMFTRKTSFMDNDVYKLLQYLDAYYAGEDK